jgi:hypothetical protein
MAYHLFNENGLSFIFTCSSDFDFSLSALKQDPHIMGWVNKLNKEYFSLHLGQTLVIHSTLHFKIHNASLTRPNGVEQICNRMSVANCKFEERSSGLVK